VSCVSYPCGSLVSAPYNGKREPSCASPVCVLGFETAYEVLLYDKTLAM
jgi:hypothetical protein